MKSHANITLCVGWFLVRIVIWSLIIGMSRRSMGCEGMYWFIMSSGVSGLLDILKTSRINDMFLGVGKFDNIFSRLYVCGSWQECCLLGVHMF